MKNYPFIITPLSSADGGGYLIEYPDLAGCMSDGENIEEAISSGELAVQAWIETAISLGREIPEPNSHNDYSGKFIQRIPKSLHSELSRKAKQEGVSINSLVLSYIAKGIGHINQ